MEINAMVYAASKDPKLLQEVHDIQKEKTFQGDMYMKTLEPYVVLLLEKTWYGFSERTEPTDCPEGWMQCLW